MPLPKDSELANVKDIRDLPVVEVHWKDAASSGGNWNTLSNYRGRGTMDILSIGFLTKRNKDEIQVVQSVSSNGDVTDAMTIPAPWVVKCRVIRKGKK